MYQLLAKSFLICACLGGPPLLAQRGDGYGMFEGLMAEEAESKEAVALIRRAQKEPGNRVEHLTAAVALGSTRAMCMLGDDAKSEATSAYWYRQALTLNGESRDGAKFVGRLGMTHFGDLTHQAAMTMADWLITKKITPENFESPEFYLEIAARRGRADGALLLSQRLVMTHDLEKLLVAEEWLVRIAGMGRHAWGEELPVVAEGAFQLAVLYLNELEDPAHGPDEIVELTLLASGHGNLHATEMAGKMITRGFGGAPNPKRGVELIAKAARGKRSKPGLNSAKMGLVGMYLEGVGVEANPEAATVLLVQLAHLASSDVAESKKIPMYAGVLDEVSRRNPNLNLKWHKRMMKNSQDTLAVLQVFIEASNAGTDVTNPKNLIPLMRAMPETNSYAQWQLGRALGKTGAEDARACLTRAAQAGLPEACTLLANWLLHGLHGPKHMPDAGYYAERSVNELARMRLVSHAYEGIRLIRDIQGDEIAQENVVKCEEASADTIAHFCLY